MSPKSSDDKVSERVQSAVACDWLVIAELTFSRFQFVFRYFSVQNNLCDQVTQD